MQRSIDDLRADEDAGIHLTSEEQARLDAFYAAIEADEVARLAPQLLLQEQERAERTNYLARLEVLLEQKKDSLLRLERLVQEIEAIKHEETRLRAAVHS